MRYNEYVSRSCMFENANMTVSPECEATAEQSIFQFFNDYGKILSFLEHVYNFIHIISAYLLPYLIEMLCYAWILVLMKRVNKEKNAEKSQLRLLDCFCFTSTKSSSTCSSLDNPTEMSSIMRARTSDENLATEKSLHPSVGTKSLSNGFYAPVSVNFESGGSLIMAKNAEKRPAWKSTVAVARRKTRRK
ncbi:unnamed protein product, partial [Enterobius vermicularis]|uniref:G_PROTEIN_RECEP_F1_2 domain-containing protein n=1 Tax=Enterobius vermicularis TaxID=51028 RepID=A0A0N4VRN9_ENTVE